MDGSEGHVGRCCLGKRGQVIFVLVRWREFSGDDMREKKQQR